MSGQEIIFLALRAMILAPAGLYYALYSVTKSPEVMGPPANAQAG